MQTVKRSGKQYSRKLHETYRLSSLMHGVHTELTRIVHAGCRYTKHRCRKLATNRSTVLCVLYGQFRATPARDVLEFNRNQAVLGFSLSRIHCLASITAGDVTTREHDMHVSGPISYIVSLISCFS